MKISLKKALIIFTVGGLSLFIADLFVMHEILQQTQQKGKIYINGFDIPDIEHCTSFYDKAQPLTSKQLARIAILKHSTEPSNVEHYNYLLNRNSDDWVKEQREQCLLAESFKSENFQPKLHWLLTNTSSFDINPFLLTKKQFIADLTALNKYNTNAIIQAKELYMSQFPDADMSYFDQQLMAHEEFIQIVMTAHEKHLFWDTNINPVHWYVTHPTIKWIYSFLENN